MVTIMASEIAVRYAQGLFELTEEMNTVKKTKEEVEALQKVLADNPDVELFFRAVKVTKQEKRNFIDQVFGKTCSHELVSFLKLLIDKGRIYCLDEILDDYVQMADEKLGIVRAVVSFARPLDEKQMEQIRTALEKKMGRTVILTNRTDPSLIAGIKVTVGNRVTDITMATKIETMRNALLKGGQA